MASSSQTQGVSKYVTLVSSDGFEFVVLREAACVSGAIKRMLDPKSTLLQTPEKCMNDAPWLTPCCLGNFAESVDGRCTFEEIKYVLLYFPWASGAEGAVSDDQ